VTGVLVFAAGAAVAVGVMLALMGARRGQAAGPPSRWRRTAQTVWSTMRPAVGSRWRLICWCGAGIAVWTVTAWPVAGIAVAATGLGAPWLMGSGRVISDRLDRLEALEGWCRRMADMLSGGGAMGLTQAITISAGHVDDVIAAPVRRLAAALGERSTPAGVAVREFADTLDDRVADTVAAALLLALQQQSVGIARVLRLLADGVARDVRARRDIEAARAESRQSIRMLLLIQAGVLAMLAVVPSFAAPYATAVGQTVMALLLASTVALLVWMRRLALGNRPPRFLGTVPATSGARR
jgi:tight adherence protein B